MIINNINKQIYFFCLLITIPTITVSQECKINGCGSGWNATLVPDKIKALKVDFLQSCNRHDACYSKCIADCGTEKRKHFCSLKELTKIKKECDTKFLSYMKQDCLTKGNNEPICYDFAHLYYLSVKTAGSFAIRANEDSTLFDMQLNHETTIVKKDIKSIYKLLKDNLAVQNSEEEGDFKQESIDDWFIEKPKSNKSEKKKNSNDIWTPDSLPF